MQYHICVCIGTKLADREPWPLPGKVIAKRREKKHASTKVLNQKRVNKY
jgi:hypothetical protein